MIKRVPKNNAPKTTAQRLDSIVKSARKIMRKDKGLNGDLDRLPDGIYDSTAAAEAARKSFGLRAESQVD